MANSKTGNADVRQSFEYQAVNSLRRARRKLRSDGSEEGQVSYNIEAAKVLALLELAEAIRSTTGKSD